MDDNRHNVLVTAIIAVAAVFVIAALSFGCGGCTAREEEARYQLGVELAKQGKSGAEIRAAVYRH